MNRIIRNYASDSVGMFTKLIFWSTANGRQTTVNFGYSMLCLFNYNLLSSMDGEQLTIFGQQLTFDRPQSIVVCYQKRTKI
jgi:hypothetical protein